jgi:soluble lytic murein transglycosylase
VSGATANARRRSRARSASTTRRRSRARARAGRRRLAILLAVVLGIAGAVYLTARGPVDDAIREITLPLRHEDIIRQQARKKNLDPALIAAMIYQESKFEDRTSPAGAKGLMQITPSTAKFIAQKSGGTAFVPRDLGTPQINIAYGTWYLRYLIQRFHGNVTLAVAAYNAGETHVDRWVEQAGGEDSFDPKTDIPFPETRGYVASVMHHRKLYRDKYRHELGLD